MNSQTIPRRLLHLRVGVGVSSSRLIFRERSLCHNCLETWLMRPSQAPSGPLGTNAKAIHTASIRSLPLSQVLYSQYKVPEVIPARPSVRRNREQSHPVSQRLLSARTRDELIEVLEQDTENMDAISLSVAVDALFDALKAETSLTVKAKHEILTTVGVQKLCKLLRRFGPHLDPGDLINGVKLLSFLSVPGNHQTLQVMLKLISKHANLFDLQQLAYLQFLLDKMDQESKSALSKALEYALPVVFESQLSSQLDKNDPQSICDYLHYATKYKLSDKSIKTLVEAALKISDRIPTRLTMSLMWSLCDVRNDDPSYEPLIQWCYRRLCSSFDQFRLEDLSTVMSKSVRKFNKRIPYYYNEEFTDLYCQRCMEGGKNVYDTLWNIKYISFFRHVSIEFIDRVGDIIAANPSLILNNDTMFTILIKALSNCNYKPEKWPSFSSILLEHPALIKKYGLPDVSLALDFLVLDLFSDNMIRTLYSGDGLPLLEEFQRKYNASALVLIYNAIKVLYPQYNGPLPPTSMIESWKESSRASNIKKQCPLTGALQSGLGGGSYVIHGLYHDGIHIDHGIVMRKGGFPVAVNSQSDSQSDCLGSITKPPESVIVLVKAFSREMYANNTRRLRGVAALELRILEALGNPVVSVDVQQWQELPDYEKIPFLMQRIRVKVDHLQWNQNWGDVIP